MLDQNTDRMWFLIGAVIVGAAIIFIANGTMSELFASVGESFEDVSAKGLEVVGQIGEKRLENLLDRSGEMFGYHMWNSGNEVPVPISYESIYPDSDNDFRHAAVKAPITVRPGDRLVFEKQSISRLDSHTDEGGNWWRVSLLDENNEYVGRWAKDEDYIEYTIPDGVFYIWPSYHTDSNPRIYVKINEEGGDE